MPPAVNVIIAWSKRTVTGVDLSPAPFRTLLNQIVLPLGIGVLLKFALSVLVSTHPPVGVGVAVGIGVAVWIGVAV
jgi:hypothetical protein